ncbi:hypothetical protein LEP1GSC008_0960 [Leptospira kirschneri serovar Bulgarica str. Nikolaevo]|uniref:Uncharacterized protein n=1 Tax=Leptospira kirschneri serovar Bulgarica str. Nikolaevo TaxID=1240687 RepID=M6FGL3_9LEPT|nr:hypothetical protein LEP1GSC008_0960 [Leptospira kirschneri serovar Bulgarica str. Nikolaevo]
MSNMYNPTFSVCLSGKLLENIYFFEYNKLKKLLVFDF